ncbi:low-density lipoprotein receptor-related protein 5-like [Strongylocentrotus purpuratus]|uniref:Uncharacterized protein n=1 Tax=Strongylocentrotus purpuratus TaxID=7668 RepID=A0A7M7NID4_STRPU|nr:low-density lipoprotein receptor-related protein 5-like [Strongylocentrotus purpuratus]
MRNLFYFLADSLMFLTDLSGGAIYVAHTNNLNFRQLPFLFVQKPVAVGYDVIAKEVYWTDVERKTLSAAQIDGSNQRIVVQGLGVPDGLFVDSDNETIFWTDTDFKTIESIQFDGSNQRVLINDVDMPRAIMIVPENRKLYWTDWGSTPKIEMSNRDGSGRQMILDTDIGWPNGITYDMQGNRLIWCDALLDKIESCDLDGGGRKILLDSTHGAFHPFGVIVYKSTVMWSDWVLKGVGVEEPDNQTWPGLYSSVSFIAQPSGFHVVVDSCSAEPCSFGTCHPLGVSNYECDCVTGFTGKDCNTAITCALPIESEDSHIEDPKNLYTPGERITITCNNNGNASTTWICNASSGYWDATEDLKCPESAMNHTGRWIGIASGVIILAVLVLTAFCVFAYIKRRKQRQVNNGNIPEPQERGPLPHVPQHPIYMDMDEDQHYYSGISNPNSIGHIYDTNLVDGKAGAQRDSREDQPRYETMLRSITQ